MIAQIRDFVRFPTLSVLLSLLDLCAPLSVLALARPGFLGPGGVRFRLFQMVLVFLGLLLRRSCLWVARQFVPTGLGALDLLCRYHTPNLLVQFCALVFDPVLRRT